MSSQQLHAIELRHRRHGPPRELAVHQLSSAVGTFIKALAWAMLGLLAVYGVAQASATVLLTVGGIVLGLLALATCIGLYGLNNTRF